MNTTTILSIDLGKFKSTACIYSPEGKHSFCALASTNEELADLLQRVRPQAVTPGSLSRVVGSGYGVLW
jgi:hypothetical protein